MIPLNRPSWALTLTCLLVFTNCAFLYYYFFSTSYSNQPAHFTSPLLTSYSYLEVVHPEEKDAWPYRVYKSAPYKPPYLTITGNGGEVAPGYVFLIPKPRNNAWIPQILPLIMSQDNDLVYCYERPEHKPTAVYNDLRVQNINGTPHLTVWEGSVVIGHGYGDVIILDDEYMKTKVSLETNILPNMPKTPLGNLDFHEQQVTDRGTVLVTAYNNTPHDLTPIGGSKDGWVADSMFFEIDIKTNEILFSWSALDHFNITKSKVPLVTYMADGTSEHAFDHFHINSIQNVGDSFLISSRHHWACYLISRRTGNVLWELNGSGEGGSFGALPPEAQFSWQHDACAHNTSSSGFMLSLFDNHNTPFDTNVTSTRVLLFNVSLPADPIIPPVLLRDMEPPKTLYSLSQGNYEAELGNKNQLVGYGQYPVIREYGPSGDDTDIRSEIRFGHDLGAQNYRAHKSEWKATPSAWAPSLVIEKESNGLKAYVSWNGATEVEYWNVYAVNRGGVLDSIGRAAAYGFETVIEVVEEFGNIQCIMVVAMQKGVEVRQSNRACLSV